MSCNPDEIGSSGIAESGIPQASSAQDCGTSTPVAVSVVVPTFNEAANLERMVHALAAVLNESPCIPFEIIVVDDDSSDGTAAIADRLAAEFAASAPVETPVSGRCAGSVRVLHRSGPKGLAVSVCEGWQSANGAVLGLIDCDFQHPPALMPQLVKAVLAGADIAVASRYAPGGGTVAAWSRTRRLISSASTLVTRLSLGKLRHCLQDPLSGCFAMRREVVQGLRLRPVGFRTLLEVLARGRYRTVREVAYLFAERRQGTSKMRFRVAFDDARQLLRVIWHRSVAATFSPRSPEARRRL